MNEGQAFRDPTDPEDIHTAAADRVSAADAAAARRADEERRGAAEAAVAAAVAAVRQALTGYDTAQADPVERARVAALAAEHLAVERDRRLRACVENGLPAGDVARKVGVRPAVVALAMTRRD